MTPEEHIATAETILANVGDQGDAYVGEHFIPELLLAIGHALVAIAVESGVPHQTTTPAVV